MESLVCGKVSLLPSPEYVRYNMFEVLDDCFWRKIFIRCWQRCSISHLQEQKIDNLKNISLHWPQNIIRSDDLNCFETLSISSVLLMNCCLGTRVWDMGHGRVIWLVLCCQDLLLLLWSILLMLWPLDSTINPPAPADSTLAMLTVFSRLLARKESQPSTRVWQLNTSE